MPSTACAWRFWGNNPASDNRKGGWPAPDQTLTDTMTDLAKTIAREFPQQPEIIYLNHAAVAPWPKRTAQAVTDFAEQNVTRGAADYMHWIGVENSLRAQLAGLVNAPSVADISLLKNTSEAISMVAWGLDWQAGDNLVFFRQEFPSNRVPWLSLQRIGVESRVLDLDAIVAGGRSPEQALMDACDARTRLIAVSSVQYASGLRTDLPLLGQFCRERGLLLCADAIQSVGALPLDVQATGVHFAMADGHKWMLGPEGLALFYTDANVRDRMQVYEFGWHMTREYSDFDAPDWHIADDGKRFECGSPNLLGAHALTASLSLLQETGMESVTRRILANTDYLMQRIDASDELLLLSNPQPERRSGIVTFAHHSVADGVLFERLRDAGVVCAKRGGGVRFSPHFYTSESALEQAILIAESA